LLQAQLGSFEALQYKAKQDGLCFVATGFRSPSFSMADYYHYNTFPQLKSSKLIQPC
jgi:hypothetical protein